MSSGCPTTTKGFYWICTLNNPTEEERALLKCPPDYISELWYQDEIGQETKTLHIQLAIRTSEVRKSTIIKDFPRMWIDKARNKLAAINYCKKEDPTAVQGTYVHWTRQEDCEVEYEPPLKQEQILLMIALWVTEDNLASDSEIQYQDAINDILSWRPELVNQLTGSRILPAWRLTNKVWLRQAQAISADDQTDRQDDLVDPGVWQGLDCGICNLCCSQCECD